MAAKDSAPLPNLPALSQLRRDLRDHQTVLILASEALTQLPTSDRLTQQRLHRMQAAIAESHRLLETLLQVGENPF
ncbi:MAG TPA: hypothetical protein DCQ32_07345 [Cyanobacteria bacterium UBA8156]|jgi:hypothetical protein|nr:hypothetical protein [Cyanobacteria bacterium UBA8156]